MSAAENSSLTMHVHALEDGASGPVLATFAQGPPSAAVLHGTDDATRMVFTLERGTGSKRRVRASSHVCEYEAHDYGERAPPRVSALYVGVVHRKRGRVDVFPCTGATVFPLALSRVLVPGGTAAAGIAAARVDDSLTARQRRDVLVQAFGSRKRQKLDKAIAANIVDVSAVAAATDVAEALKLSTEAMSASDKGTSADRVDAALMASRVATLPPFNVEAVQLKDAYPLDALIPEAVTESLKEAVAEAMECVRQGDTAALLSVHGLGSHYVRSRLEATVSLELRDKELRRRLRCLLYAKCLIYVARAPMEVMRTVPWAQKQAAAEGGPAAATAADVVNQLEAMTGGATSAAVGNIASFRYIPPNIHDVLLAAFFERTPDPRGASTDGIAYLRTAQLHDKVIAHLCCLTLHAESFQTDVADLANDLKLSVQRLSNYYREMGCTTTPVRTAVADADASTAAATEEDEDGVLVAGVKRTNTKTMLTSYSVKLNLPLTFPRLKLGKKNK